MLTGSDVQRYTLASGKTLGNAHHGIWDIAHNQDPVSGEHTYCNVEHHACSHFALIPSLEQIDGLPELKPHAKTNIFWQMLNQVSLPRILQK